MPRTYELQAFNTEPQYKSPLCILADKKPCLKLCQCLEKSLYVRRIQATVKMKGTMSPHTHARIDEKHLEIIDPTFSNTVREFSKLFSSV